MSDSKLLASLLFKPSQPPPTKASPSTITLHASSHDTLQLTQMYSYPTIEEPQLADQDWYPTTQDFFSYPVPTVADHEPSPQAPQPQPQLFRPQYMGRSSSFSPSLDQLKRGDDFKTLMLPSSSNIHANAPHTQFTATRMKRSYTQPEKDNDTLRRSQSMMALSVSTDGRARLQPRESRAARDHSPHKFRIEEDIDSQSSYSDNVFSDRSSMSSASSASPQLASDFPSCVPVPVGVSRSKSCVSLSQFGGSAYPSLPPPAVSAASSTFHSPCSSPSPSVSSSSDEDDEVAAPKNDACVALARLVARKRSKSLKSTNAAPQRPPHVRSRSLVGASDTYQTRAAMSSTSTMESFQSRARRACAPVVPPASMLTPPASATSDKGFDFGMTRTSMRSISPKRGRTSMAVAFNYTDDSPHSHFHRRQMSLSDLSQLSLQPVQSEWSN
ncbi:hypothetical protein B0I72DRAFT_30298 [Yarrowia lipolytica]|uniref:Uncharacterized protein n=1 Tax=Yarrowia lipolytica TaxID=4952 RepID=A0A371C6Z8_YARLL|nr:hypothetical protein B0I71DRAFT_35858 [Yarrowia lipolytica]RDW35570.1 hypothetical protein B0I72DRAFT_30298 [Yarrowia lipolytica]RDW41963.1 hypothetical protein B0I73DRAFT_42060 [Yarrowia lipolytica]RDW46449.1 hypothetical protein B0I74DRAFT_27849 [Yarrowia lipolytica]RDW52901.1 hypothetical protein B0I75DRAFT_27926 [Yarrowia lipolytica]